MPTHNEILEQDELPIATLSPEEACIRHAGQCSGYFRRLLSSDESLWQDLLQNMQQPFAEQAMRDFLQNQVINDEATLKQALRKLRQRVMLRVMARDLNQLADLNEVMRCMTQLAEVTVQVALQHLLPWQEVIYGSPIGESGEKQTHCRWHG